MWIQFDVLCIFCAHHEDRPSRSDVEVIFACKERQRESENEITEKRMIKIKDTGVLYLFLVNNLHFI